jgi:hypothetical protein
MKKFLFVLFVALTLLTSQSALAKNQHGIPDKVLSARTVYVDNQTTDAALQQQAVMGLSRWARYDIVDSADKADIIIRLSGSYVVKYVPSEQAPATYDPKPAEGGGEELAPPGCTKVAVIEPKSGATLWSEIRKTNSVQEKSHLIDGLHDAVDQQVRHNK